MEKEFVKYNQALALKELGFNEPCLAIYYSKDLSFSWHHHKDHTNDEPALESGEFNISAPLYQQVFRWFREKYNLYPSINIYNDKWLCLIKSTVQSETEVSGYVVDTINNGHPTFNTYEEAELECLEKLIEIVEQKNEK